MDQVAPTSSRQYDPRAEVLLLPELVSVAERVLFSFGLLVPADFRLAPAI